jgi:UDP-glucuronate 4-epimerase
MYLITGVAGFIGFNLAKALCDSGVPVVGLDNLNTHCYTGLKQERLNILKQHKTNFTFLECDVTKSSDVARCVLPYQDRITHVIHFAALAGVRHSINHGPLYVENIEGQTVMLDLCRTLPLLEHFIYASSSSVYGNSVRLPSGIDDNTDHPLSPYAASKKAAEMFAESYASIFPLRATGLRMFSVYGPWGRPDMAYFSMTKKILSGQPIELFNEGHMKRDFTYIDDVVTGILAIAKHRFTTPPAHKIYNLGSGRNQSLNALVECIENATATKAIRRNAPFQSGEVLETCADISASTRDFSYKPTMELAEGLKRFVGWYKDFFRA